MSVLKSNQSPELPAKGDSAACQRYATYRAALSENPNRVFVEIWVNFLMDSFLGEDGKELSI